MIRTFCKTSLYRSCRIRQSAWAGALVVLLLAGTAGAAEAEYVPYPGVYPARLKSVETPGRFVFEVPVWTGFVRVLTITIPDIAVPRSTGGAPKCERELAGRARKFSEAFLTQASRVEVHDITMQNTGDTNAKAPVFTNAGSLADALKKGGFARSSDVPSDTPWCVDKGK